MNDGGISRRQLLQQRLRALSRRGCHHEPFFLGSLVCTVLQGGMVGWIILLCVALLALQGMPGLA